MVLESLDNNSINIKNLALEEQQVKHVVHFDPFRDISNEDWKEKIDSSAPNEFIDNRVDFVKEEKNNLIAFLEDMASLKILHPHLPSDFDFTNDEFSSLKEAIEKLKDEGDMRVIGRMGTSKSKIAPIPLYYFSALAYLKLISESRFREMNLDDSLLFEEAKDNIVDFEFHPISLLPFKIIFPERFQQFGVSLNFSPSITEDIGNILKNTSEKIPTAESIKAATCARLIFPEKFKTINIPNEKWDQMIDYFKRPREGLEAWENFDLPLAFYLTVLSAEEVSVDKDGIHIVMQKEETKELPQIPEGRKF